MGIFPLMSRANKEENPTHMAKGAPKRRKTVKKMTKISNILSVASVALRKEDVADINKCIQS